MPGSRSASAGADFNLLHLSRRVFDTPVAISQDSYESIVHVLGSRIGIDPILLPIDQADSSIPAITLNSELTLEQLKAIKGIFNGKSNPGGSGSNSGSSAGSSSSPSAGGDEDESDSNPYSGKPYKVTEDGVAIIPIRGTLVKKSSWLAAACGMASYQGIEAQVAECIEDDGIRAILFDISSPGGETHGLFDLCDRLYSLRSDILMYACANDAALSAAYAIASCASKIFVTRTGAVGSIGVFSGHVDQSGADAQAGLKFTYIHAGKKKTDGNPHEPLSKSARTDAQAEVDREYQMFVDLVSRNRHAEEDAIISTQAGVLFADNAIPLLADKVGTLDDAYQAVVQKLSSSSGSGGEARPRTSSANRVSVTMGRAATSGFLAGAAIQASGVSGASGEQMPVIGYKKTGTMEGAWSASANRNNLLEGKGSNYYSRAHAYRDGTGDPKSKGSYTYIHHMVSSTGDIGAANLTACSSAIAALNGSRSGGGRRSYTPDERRGIYNHVAHHLKDAGHTPSPLKSYSDYLTERMTLGLIDSKEAKWLKAAVASAIAQDATVLAALAGPIELNSEGDKNPMASTATKAANEETELLAILGKKADDAEADDMKECPDCGGTGKDDEDETCETCGGSGEVEKGAKKAAAAAKDADEEEEEDEEESEPAPAPKKKKKTKGKPAAEYSKKKAAAVAVAAAALAAAKDSEDDDDDEDEDEEEEEEPKPKKKAALAAAATLATRDPRDPRKIMELCQIAGLSPQLTVKYASGSYTLAQVRSKILDSRAKQDADPKTQMSTFLSESGGLRPSASASTHPSMVYLDQIMRGAEFLVSREATRLVPDEHKFALKNVHPSVKKAIVEAEAMERILSAAPGLYGQYEESRPVVFGSKNDGAKYSQELSNRIDMGKKKVETFMARDTIAPPAGWQGRTGA